MDVSGRLRKDDSCRACLGRRVAGQGVAGQRSRLRCAHKNRVRGLAAALPFLQPYVAVQIHLRPPAGWLQFGNAIAGSCGLHRPSAHGALRLHVTNGLQLPRLSGRSEIQYQLVRLQFCFRNSGAGLRRRVGPFHRSRRQRFGLLRLACLARFAFSELQAERIVAGGGGWGSEVSVGRGHGARVSVPVGGGPRRGSRGVPRTKAGRQPVPGVSWGSPACKAPALGFAALAFVALGALSFNVKRTSRSKCTVPSSDLYSSPAASPLPLGNANVTFWSVRARPLARSNFTPRVSICVVTAFAASGWSAVRCASASLIRSTCTSPLHVLSPFSVPYFQLRV